MTVHVTQPRDVALQDWTGLAWMIGLVSLGCLVWIGIAALALARWWRQLQALGMERAERAEAERARALAEADLARERERHAEERSKARSGFLAMMSHEIRTPMNGVLGLTGTLLDGELTAQQRRVVEAIRDSGDSLLRILNDILDLSKLDAGRMTFEDMAFAPVILTHGIVSILGPRARAKGLIIIVSCDHALPEALLGDAGRIRQVLLNLVSNAIKFTETGSVTIECRQISRADGNARVQWVIRDTGIGIAPDRIGSLFGDFVQADTTITRRFGGTGMGLAISRRLVEQMGGAIAVESEPGQGTSFRVDLVLPVTAPRTGQERRVADVVGAFDAYVRTLGRPLRLLFAEDNPTNQFVALQMLRAFNVQVDVAGDGLEAVDAATTFLYDVICMDMRMPEMDGLDATRLIRRQGGRLADLPIIALTANAFPEDVKACLDAGMNLFVAKPVHKETLLHAILTALGALTRFTELELPRPEAVEPQPPQAAPDGPALDAAVLAEMEEAIGEDGLVEMIRLFLSETHSRLDRLGNGERDASIDLREVHTLKGAAATVGAPTLTAFALETEERLREGGSLSAADVDRLRRHFEAWRDAIGSRIPLDQPWVSA
jgi:signal transduction histidine kinase/DNA-binding NarL/FixJ family response regulator